MANIHKYKILRIVSYYLIKDKTPEGHLVDIPSQAFKNICNDYRKYINQLIYDNILIVDESYSTDKNYSKAYGFHPDVDLQFIAFQISLAKHPRFKVGNLFPIANHLKYLKVDESEAKAVIDTIDDRNKQLHAWTSVYDINNGQHFFVRDKFGRVHCNVTTMKREVRPLMKYKGHDCNIVDVNSSHPFQQAVLQQYKPDFLLRYLPKQIDVSQILPDYQFYDDVINNNLKPKFYHLLPDVGSYIKTYGKQKTGNWFDVIDSTIQKKMLLKAFNDYRNTPITKCLQNLYPQTVDNLKYFRSHTDNKKQAFALIHQRAEANLMVDNVCLIIARKTLALPIHDAVFVLEKDLDMTIDRIEKVYQSNISIQPNLKVENHAILY